MSAKDASYNVLSVERCRIKEKLKDKPAAPKGMKTLASEIRIQLQKTAVGLIIVSNREKEGTNDATSSGFSLLKRPSNAVKIRHNSLILCDSSSGISDKANTSWRIRDRTASVIAPIVEKYLLFVSTPFQNPYREFNEIEQEENSFTIYLQT